jgi:hypothetical protein
LRTTGTPILTAKDCGRVMADDLATAIRLLEAALHLRVNGERAPGGNETWRDWHREAERFLRDRGDGAS